MTTNWLKRRFAYPKSKPKRNEWEHNEQVVIATKMAIKYPEILFNADCGGLWTSPNQARKMKAAGHKAGFPDLFVAEARQGYHGLFIELKAPKNALHAAGTVSPEQENWINWLNDRGYAAIVCYGADEALKYIDNYLLSK